MALPNLFDLTATEFEKLVMGAKREGKSGRYRLAIDGVDALIRLRRGAMRVNQNHPYLGEPVVVHVPGDQASQPDSWFVLSVRTLIEYALKHPSSKQHTVHAMDCFFIDTQTIDATHGVAPAMLKPAIENAVRDTRKPDVQRVVRKIGRARTRALLLFEDAADDAALALGIALP